jgi:hypothetical protein
MESPLNLFVGVTLLEGGSAANRKMYALPFSAPSVSPLHDKPQDTDFIVYILRRIRRWPS